MLPKLYPFKDQLNPVEFALIKHTHIMPPFPWSLDTWKIQGANFGASFRLMSLTFLWTLYLEPPHDNYPVTNFPVFVRQLLGIRTKVVDTLWNWSLRLPHHNQAIPRDTKGQSDTITKVQLKGVKSRSCYGQSGGKLSCELTAGNPGRTTDWLCSSFASDPVFPKSNNCKEEGEGGEGGQGGEGGRKKEKEEEEENMKINIKNTITTKNLIMINID